jgi:hypothetical protein
LSVYRGGGSADAELSPLSRQTAGAVLQNFESSNWDGQTGFSFGKFVVERDGLA